MSQPETPPPLPPPLVSLVGAGPGDADLITVRGLKRLREAEVVIYDSLAGTDLLAHCAPDAELISAGKRCGAHGAEQTQINALLVEKARAGLRVVRLKGGDPLVFGRGGEEALALAEAGIACEIIPGVTAAAAAAAAAQIPLTHRALSGGVLFLTGHESAKPADIATRVPWEQAGALPDVTLCIYMGVKNLPAIAARLLAGGMAAETPLAVVSKASLPDETVHETTVGAAAAGALDGEIETPALVLIGAVVRARPVPLKK
ncbi:MAG: uroporphyrinogen-III C-methyltransferase [Puniceicoccales bacterium]|jgi:uroporphyrin-III C-methyltransferase|nr:uroporphyrinogen-III C-methyltransferase [Puniceicoccales bacterium]